MSAYLATVRRLMGLATVVRGRSHHPKRYMIEMLAGVIEDAAIAIQTNPVDEPGQIPEPAASALDEAAALLAQHEYGIPAVLIGYATAPVTGRTPTMRPLNAVSQQLARHDADLRARRAALIERGHLASREDDVLHAAFTSLIALHRSHDRLAVLVADDSGRPCNRGKTAADLAH